MKNKLKLLLVLFVIFIISSCNHVATITPDFEGDINLYTNLDGTRDEKNKILFNYKYDYALLDNNVLCMYFELEIGNPLKEQVIIKLEDAKAYGNDTELDEEVLTDYVPGYKEYTKKFTNSEYNIYKMEQASLGIKTLNFKLVIQDGNPNCKYKLVFKMNNVNLYLYSYSTKYNLDNFEYIHNPSYLKNVMDDCEYDKNAVFGYKPNTTGSLKQFAEYNWYDKDTVYQYKEERILYIKHSDERIKSLENELRNENKTIEEIARACSKLRNEIRLEQYKDDPEGLEKIKQRNLEKYGYEDGPKADDLYNQYGSWEIVLSKCYSTNRGMDACCGVYDMYFNLYTPFAY